MAGWHHQLNGRELEYILEVGDGRGSLACCSLWGGNESVMSEQLNWTDRCNARCWAHALESEPELRFAGVLIGGELHCGASFCSTREWAGGVHTCIPSRWRLLPTPLPRPTPQALACEHKRSSLLLPLAVCLAHGVRDLSVQATLLIPPASTCPFCAARLYSCLCLAVLTWRQLTAILAR